MVDIPAIAGPRTEYYEFFCHERKIGVLLFRVGRMDVSAGKISRIFCDFEDRTGV
jgi:hypothetical protein